MKKDKWFWKKVQEEDGKVVWYAHAVCEKCGNEFRSNNAARAKYCPACKKSVIREQTRARVRRYRLSK